MFKSKDVFILRFEKARHEPIEEQTVTWNCSDSLSRVALGQWLHDFNLLQRNICIVHQNLWATDDMTTDLSPLKVAHLFPSVGRLRGCIDTTRYLLRQDSSSLSGYNYIYTIVQSQLHFLKFRSQSIPINTRSFVYFFIHLKTNGEILYIRITSYDSTPKVVPSRGSDDRRRSFSTSLWSRGEIAVPRVFRRLQTPQKSEQAEKRNAFHKPPIVSKCWFHVSFGESRLICNKIYIYNIQFSVQISLRT